MKSRRSLTSPQNAAARPATGAALRPQPYRVARTRLANGLRVVTIETPHLHTASIALYAGVGARYETRRRRTGCPTSSSTCCSAARTPSRLVRPEPRHRERGRDPLRRDGPRLLALPDPAAPVGAAAGPGDPGRSLRHAALLGHRARAPDHPRGDPGGSRRGRAERERRRRVARGGVGRSPARLPHHGPARQREALPDRRGAGALPLVLRRRQHGAVPGRPHRRRGRGAAGRARVRPPAARAPGAPAARRGEAPPRARVPGGGERRCADARPARLAGLARQRSGLRRAVGAGAGAGRRHVDAAALPDLRSEGAGLPRDGRHRAAARHRAGRDRRRLRAREAARAGGRGAAAGGALPRRARQRRRSRRRRSGATAATSRPATTTSTASAAGTGAPSCSTSRARTPSGCACSTPSRPRRSSAWRGGCSGPSG